MLSKYIEKPPALPDFSFPASLSFFNSSSGGVVKIRLPLDKSQPDGNILDRTIRNCPVSGEQIHYWAAVIGFPLFFQFFRKQSFSGHSQCSARKCKPPKAEQFPALLVNRSIIPSFAYFF
jgi:hypothetical protein